MLNKKTVDDINVSGKRVLVRCDFNVPLKDGKITDENRLTAALPTIKKLINDGGKIILCSHRGKPKNGPGTYGRPAEVHGLQTPADQSAARRTNMEFEKLQQIISEVLNVDVDEITPSTTFVDDLGADSLDIYQIIIGIEEEFDIEIPQEEAEKITTVGDAAEAIKTAVE